MSRIGKEPVKLADGVTVAVDGQKVTDKGKLGELSYTMHDGITAKEEAGKVIVMTTQVPNEGSDLSVYVVGGHLKSTVRILEAHDMTTEAALTKLMWIMGQTEDFDRISGGVDYRHAGQENGIEKLGLLGELYGADINSWTEDQKKGMTGTRVVERPGYVQIGFATYADDNRNSGGTNQVGSLVTPELTKAFGTVNLSFKAMCYRSPFTGRANMSSKAQEDITDIVVNIKGAGSFKESSSVTSMTLKDIPTNKFDTRTLTIHNTDATTRIEFTSNAVAGKFTRWFLDDISVSKRNN